jgi:hypothetical protein
MTWADRGRRSSRHPEGHRQAPPGGSFLPKAEKLGCRPALVAPKVSSAQLNQGWWQVPARFARRLRVRKGVAAVGTMTLLGTSGFPVSQMVGLYPVATAPRHRALAAGAVGVNVTDIPSRKPHVSAPERCL